MNISKNTILTVGLLLSLATSASSKEIIGEVAEVTTGGVIHFEDGRHVRQWGLINLGGPELTQFLNGRRIECIVPVSYTHLTLPTKRIV